MGGCRTFTEVANCASRVCFHSPWKLEILFYKLNALIDFPLRETSDRDRVVPYADLFPSLPILCEISIPPVTKGL